jgi:hypothetical protein
MQLRALCLIAVTMAPTACGGSDDASAATAVEQRACEIACECSTPCEIVYEAWYAYSSEEPQLRPIGLDPTAEDCEAVLVEERREPGSDRLRLFDTDACLAALDAAECTQMDWGPMRAALMIPPVCYSRERPRE